MASADPTILERPVENPAPAPECAAWLQGLVMSVHAMAYDEALSDRLCEILEGEPGFSERRCSAAACLQVDRNMAVAASGQGG